MPLPLLLQAVPPPPTAGMPLLAASTPPLMPGFSTAAAPRTSVGSRYALAGSYGYAAQQPLTTGSGTLLPQPAGAFGSPGQQLRHDAAAASTPPAGVAAEGAGSALQPLRIPHARSHSQDSESAGPSLQPGMQFAACS